MRATLADVEWRAGEIEGVTQALSSSPLSVLSFPNVQEVHYSPGEQYNRPRSACQTGPRNSLNILVTCVRARRTFWALICKRPISPLGQN